jgi:hypothetical protein
VRPVELRVIGVRAAARGLRVLSAAVVLAVICVCWLCGSGAAAATDWTVQSPPAIPGLTNGQLAAVSCAASRHCMAVGSYVDAAGVTLTLAERFTRGRWSVQRTPNPSGTSGASLLGVSCPSARLCVAVGAFTGPGDGQRVLIERWNGQRLTFWGGVLGAGEVRCGGQ